MIAVTLGDQDFTDGQFITTVPFNTASAGEPAPFDGFKGSDISADFSESFTFNFAPDTILSASLTFGIFDHDSSAVGDQVALFSLDGIVLTATLNALFNGSGGGDNGFLGSEYNVYTVVLGAPELAALADGAGTFALTLQGPGLGGFGNTTFNGAGLDFATLNLETPGPAVPEPSTWILLTLGLAGIAWRRRR
jgi:hypothetical protein